MTDSSEIALGPGVFQDQREVLQQFGWDEEAAEEAYSQVKTNVMLSAQDADRDLSDGEIHEVTNVLLAQANSQQFDRMAQEQSGWLDLSPAQFEKLHSLMRLLSVSAVSIIVGVNIGDGTALLTTQFVLPLLALFFVLYAAWSQM